jgi:hypothetical protein
MSRVRAIDKAEAKCVNASRENVVAAGWDIAWIFPCYDELQTARSES